MAVVLRSNSESLPQLVPVDSTDPIELSVVMPCLNEAETLGTCIRKAQQAIRGANFAGEVIVADNGSNDGSIEIAERLGPGYACESAGLRQCTDGWDRGLTGQVHPDR